MQELRLVLIIVGALAIGALLFHGLWTSKREGKSKFGSKPLGKLDMNSAPEPLEMAEDFAPAKKPEVSRKKRKEPDFSRDDVVSDPLFDDFSTSQDSVMEEPITHKNQVPPIAEHAVDSVEEKESTPVDSLREPILTADSSEPEVEPELSISDVEPVEEAVVIEPAPELSASTDTDEPSMEVLVLSVHCAGNEPFVGTRLFDSMQQNGLLYGEMNIFHRHSDLSGTGKVLFSVANIMQPGTLEHTDPAEFTTKGISFFMTLPCYGEADQNFKLMLKTAQQIADDLGGNVLDDQRNLMTPDRLSAYRKQIQDFTAATA